MKKFAIYQLLAALLSAACVAQPTDGTDGNTHWVRCSSDERCERGECVDGRCMQEPQQPALDADTVETDSSAVQAGNPLGAACIPGEEFLPEFAGFSRDDVGVGQNPQCASELCLVNNFEGRVTCAYGSTQDAAGECTVPGSGAALTVPVQAQLLDRRAEDAVYCSCRCDGPDPDAEYCQCGDGFMCSAVIDFSIVGSEEAIGSYCVKEGTDRDPSVFETERCDRSSESCGALGSDSPASLGVELEPGADPPELTLRVQVDRIVIGDEETCLARPLPILTDAGGTAARCRLFEGTFGAQGDACTGVARSNVGPSAQQVARRKMLQTNACASEAECEQIAVCEITQLTGSVEPEQYASCLNDLNPEGNGWCYVDPSKELGDDALVDSCPDHAKRRIRFAGAGQPNSDAPLVLACAGEL